MSRQTAAKTRLRQRKAQRKTRWAWISDRTVTRSSARWTETVKVRYVHLPLSALVVLIVILIALGVILATSSSSVNQKSFDDLTAELTACQLNLETKADFCIKQLGEITDYIHSNCPRDAGLPRVVIPSTLGGESHSG